jgi:hypothetical protein
VRRSSRPNDRWRTFANARPPAARHRIGSGSSLWAYPPSSTPSTIAVVRWATLPWIAIKRRATVEWSHQLEPELQRLFEWMAMFPGGFEPDAALRRGAPWPGTELGARPVGSLVRKSMVRPTSVRRLFAITSSNCSGVRAEALGGETEPQQS